MEAFFGSRSSPTRRAWLWLGLLALGALACGEDAGTPGGSSQSGSGGAPTGGGGDSSTGGGTGATPSQGGGGSGAEGGTGGNPPAGQGSSSNAFVSAGDYVTSQNYKLVFTMGQSSQNQSKMTSQNYRLQGGLIGATGSLP